MYCNYCGKKISNDSLFCVYCGSRINNSDSNCQINTINALTITNSNQNKFDSNGFGDWYVSISFGKSSSTNFPQAVGLAKMATKYIENNIDGQILYQAIYSSTRKEYLMFIKLYELVSKWKSCYVMINGELIDKKNIQRLNYCYGDKCRSNDKNFCFGASYMTENIFGCHRLQISACNHPVYMFYQPYVFGMYKLNEQSLIARISEKAELYKFCPSFDYNYIINIVKQLPQIITSKQYQKLINGDTILKK